MQNFVLRKRIILYVENIQYKILNYKFDKQLDFISLYVFDLINRIYAIELVYLSSKGRNYNQVGYSVLRRVNDKFILLQQTKFYNALKLPPCKIVIEQKIDLKGSRKTLSINLPVDKVLQQMFLNFLDVIVESRLNKDIYAFRKGRHALNLVANLYTRLKKFEQIEKIKLCIVNFKNCFDKLSHSMIYNQYPFPKKFKMFLSR
jgi:retron-type reverse transcriptase